MLNLDPLQPYMLLIKIGGAVALAASLFVGGCVHGEKEQAEDDAREMSDMSMTIESQNESLRRVNEAAEKAKKDEKEAADRAKDAGKIEAQNEKDLKKRVARLQKELDDARRRSPECEALMSTSVKKVCHL